MSTPNMNTQSMMMAFLIDRISALEQRVANAPAEASTATPAPMPLLTAPVSAPTPVATVTPQHINIEIEEEEEVHTGLVGIGNSEQVAILARVSTSEQKASNRDSLQCQVEACTEQMRKMGCKNAFLIRQIDESATKDGYQQEEFFDTVTKFRKYPVVFVRTVTRFGRQTKLGLQRLERIHQAGGRLIFGVSEHEGLVWYDSSTQAGKIKFESQIQIAEGWAKEMSITARDNAKRKREREQSAQEPVQSGSKRTRKQTIQSPPEEVRLTPEQQAVQRMQRQNETIQTALNKNNRDSHVLRRLIDWIRLARRGGSNTIVLNGLKDLVDWKLWKNHPQYNQWRTNPWVFTETKKNTFAEPNELSFEWIATNLREWRIRIPPIRGIANVRSAWTPEIVRMMADADSTQEITQLIQRL